MNDRQSIWLVVIVASIFLGLGVLLISWSAVAQREQTAVLEQELKNISATLNGYQDAFSSLHAGIRQLEGAVHDWTAAKDGIIPGGQGYDASIHNVTENGNETAGVSEYSQGIEAVGVLLSPEQEAAQVVEIVDKLRARDMSYPDFPSLMTSPEMQNLSPEAKDRVMVEVARMFEGQQMDPLFFPEQ